MLSPTTLVSLALGALAAAQLLAGWPSVRQTTLAAPWCWCLGALAGVAVSAGEPTGYFRYAAAMLSLAPLVALLGAKRPQDGAWQFVVATLWLLLALPALTAWLLQPGTPPEPHIVVKALLIVMLLVGASNYLATRYWLANLAAVAGQACLVYPWMIGGLATTADNAPSALALWNAALIAARLARPPRYGSTFDRVWLEFRDTFGVTWSLRVLERFNNAARLNDWPLWLGWSGLLVRHEPAAPAESSLPPDPDAEPAWQPMRDGAEPAIAAPLHRTAEQCLDSVLRRFVSPEWIARHRQ